MVFKVVCVLGQMSYERGCLAKVISALKRSKDTELVEEAVEGTVSVHRRYESFSARSCKEAEEYVARNLRGSSPAC